MQISRQQVTEVAPFTFVAEASELGFPVGRVPTRLEANVLGNGRILDLIRVEEGVFVYKQQFGCLVIKVFND